MFFAPALLSFLACRSAPGADVPPPRETGRLPDDTAGTDDPADTGAPPDTGDTTAPGLPVVLGVWPAQADPVGGGGAITVEVSDATDIRSAQLGGASLASLTLLDATHVSGVPQAHEAGEVELRVEGANGWSEPVAFEYWSPQQMPALSTFLDAARGIELASDGSVSAWVDQSPEARRFEAVSGAAPTWAEAQFGTMPGLTFVPTDALRLAAPVSLADAGTSAFAVVRWTATTTTDPTGNGGNVPLTLIGDSVSAYGSFGARGGEIESNHYGGNPYGVRGGSDLNDGTARLIGAAYDTFTATRIYVGNAQTAPDDISAPFIGSNTYDTIGAGWPLADGWDGHVAAVVITGGVMADSDRARLDRWAEQRWGTPTSAPLDGWTRAETTRMPTAPDEWYPRDGAQMVVLDTGRVLAIGGWSPYDPWGDRTTNEVWASDDSGATWFLLLAHDPDPPLSGLGARFKRGHTVGVAGWNGTAVVIGTDPMTPPYLGEVWHASDNGATWTLVGNDAPSEGRSLFMLGTLGSDLYLMGGQENIYTPDTGIADLWRSSDGGVTWEEAPTPPWDARGMVYRPVEADGKLYIVGGGLYGDPTVVTFNGVYTFDGTDWETVLDDGHTQFEATQYNALTALNGRLWLFNGVTDASVELSRALYSDDGGRTWQEHPGGSGGYPSHADNVVALSDRILRISGSLNQNMVYTWWPPAP